MANRYDDNSIQILEGLEAVRKRPGMYIGSTDSRGLHHLIWEIVDNSIDEALNGYGKKIQITLEADGSVTVQDEGRGMPIGQHASGVNTLQVIFTVLHAGGKFSSEGGYKTAGGLHGVGASVVNALSEWLTVEVAHDGELVRMEFADGGKKIGKLEHLGKTNRTGSTVRFKPDPRIFSTTEYKYDVVCERAREEAFLLSGIAMVVSDKRNKKNETETKCITILDENYPKMFNILKKPPFVMYYRGNIKLLEYYKKIHITGNYEPEYICKYLALIKDLPNDCVIVNAN